MTKMALLVVMIKGHLAKYGLGVQTVTILTSAHLTGILAAEMHVIMYLMMITQQRKSTSAKCGMIAACVGNVRVI